MRLKLSFFSRSRTNNHTLRSNHNLSLFSIAILFALVYTIIVLIPPNLIFIKTVSYIVGYILIPGILMENLFFRMGNPLRSLILGFLLQLIFAFFTWILYRMFGAINFFLMLTVSTVLFIIISMAVCVKLKPSGAKFSLSLKEIDIFLCFSLIFYAILAVYFGQYITEPNSDGASYLDLARNICDQGVFRSNMLSPPYDWGNVIFGTGGHPHMFGYFTFALFFTFGNVSVSSAKNALIFSGLLIIIAAYLLAREFFDINTARLTSFVIGTSALFVTHSSLIGGPEFISALFALLSIYVFTLSFKLGIKRLAVLAGLSSFITWYSWYLNYYTLLIVYLCIIICFTSIKRESVKINVLIFLLLSATFMLDDRIISNFGFETVGLPFPLLSILTILLIYLIAARKSKLAYLYMILVGILITLDFSLLFFILTSLESKIFHTSLLQTGITIANIKRDVNVISRIFKIESVMFYWNMYKDGIYRYIGQTTILLALISLVRVERSKETLILAVFPLFQALIWSLLVVIDAFQPRYAITVSLFYDILLASAIIFISQNAVNYINLNKNIALTIRKISIRIDIKKLITAFFVILLLAFQIGLTFQLYDDSKSVVQSWNFRQKFGWSKAINWINNNTSSKDRFACIYGDYFVWYTNRQTAFLWSIADKNSSTLIEIIRTLHINYLIVDEPFRNLFKDLSGLYDNPNPFLGSSIAYMCWDTSGKKVIIYNVTNIAYGTLTEYVFEPQWRNPENWAPLLWYCNGNISQDQDAIRVDFVAVERQPVSGAATLYFESLTDLRNYTCIEFSVKTPVAGKIYLEVYTGFQGQNYFTYSVVNNVTNEWCKITINLNDVKSIIGTPNMQDCSKLNFIFSGVLPGEPSTFWIKDIKFNGQKYILEKVG